MLKDLLFVRCDHEQHVEDSAKNKPKKSLFRLFYDRGDIPAFISYNQRGQKVLSWKIDKSKINYQQMLPIFFDGLEEKDYPYKYVVAQGILYLLKHCGDEIVPAIPRLIMPIKKALLTHNKPICCRVIKVLQTLVNSHPGVGEALVPYYRQILPTFSYFFSCNENLGDGIEYSQRKRENIGDLIDETLKLFEVKGGEFAYFNIKYMVPVYESTVLPG